MSFLENIPYKESLTIKGNSNIPTDKSNITITRYHCDCDVYDRYYLRANMRGNDNRIKNQGYLYFYINPERRQSQFIGVGVSDQYRNKGIASLLISSWVMLSLDEDFSKLSTIAKQRKPFPLYILKKYEFELDNPNKYQTSPKVVHICKRENDDRKYIMFQNKQEETRFRNSNIMKTDNYMILDPKEDSVIIDRVVLDTPYYLQDKERAYQKSLQLYHSKIK